MKGALVTLFIIAALLGAGSFAFVFFQKEPLVVEEPVAEQEIKTETIGRSVQGRAISAVTYGNGSRHLLFVGGIHGGYEWNSVLLANQFMDYLAANLHAVPENITVTVIPSLNPDGVYKVVGKEGRFSATDVSPSSVTQASGRFNANNIDLNRNFDCKWQPQSTWRSEVVGAGSAPFSEPEARALRDFVLTHRPSAVVFWHSQANAVYASECEAGVLPQTLMVMNTYATAANYPAVASFDAYPVTGDAEGWLASINIPAITVELSTHQQIEWERNLAGIKSLLTLYAR